MVGREIENIFAQLTEGWFAEKNVWNNIRNNTKLKYYSAYYVRLLWKFFSKKKTLYTLMEGLVLN